MRTFVKNRLQSFKYPEETAITSILVAMEMCRDGDVGDALVGRVGLPRALFPH